MIKRSGRNGFAKTAAPASTTASNTAKSYAKSAKIALSNATPHAIAKSGVKKSGTYYIYDGKVTKGRMRITNAAANVGKTSVGSYVTGWMQKSGMR